MRILTCLLCRGSALRLDATRVWRVVGRLHTSGSDPGPVTSVCTRVRVRTAGPDDLAALAALMRRVERAVHAGSSRPEALEVHLHRRCTAWYLLGRLGAGDRLFVAEADGRPLGMTAVQLVAGPRGGRLHLHGTTVESAREAVQRPLLRAALRVGDRPGLRVLTADCLAGDRPAQDRLRQLGLQPVGSPTPSTTLPGDLVVHWRGSWREAVGHVDGLE